MSSTLITESPEITTSVPFYGAIIFLLKVKHNVGYLLQNYSKAFSLR